MVKKSPEAVELEQIREKILLKQAKLFEQRLDAYLKLGDPNTDPKIRKEVFSHLIEVPESQYQFEESQVSQINFKEEESNEENN